MRNMLAMAAGAVALVWMGSAAAAPVPLSVSFSPEFQRELEENYGAREGVILHDDVVQAVGAALAHRGLSAESHAGVTIEISIVDADPNRPTLQQLTERPGLDPIRSLSLGGAELHAVLRGADGQELGQVSHRQYDATLADVHAASTWTEARSAIRRFAAKVAAAYADQG